MLLCGKARVGLVLAGLGLLGTLLVGCTASSVPGVPSDTDISLISDPTAPGVPLGSAMLRMTVRWPEGGEVGARYIFTGCTAIDLEVTGGGITTPVTGSIVRPDDSISLTVPAGTDRSVLFTQRDAGGEITHTHKDGLDLPPGYVVDVTVDLNDEFEPNEDGGPSHDALGVPFWCIIGHADHRDSLHLTGLDSGGGISVTISLLEGILAPTEYLRVWAIEGSPITSAQTAPGVLEPLAISWTVSSSTNDTYVYVGIFPDAPEYPGSSVGYRLTIAKDGYGSADMNMTVQ